MERAPPLPSLLRSPFLVPLWVVSALALCDATSLGGGVATYMTPRATRSRVTPPLTTNLHGPSKTALRPAYSSGRRTSPLRCTQRARIRSRHARASHCTLHARQASRGRRVAAHTPPQRQPQPQDSSTRTRATLRAARTALARPAPPPVAAPLNSRNHARTTTHDDEKMRSAHTGANKAGDADRWGTATLGGRPGNGDAVLFLPCERGSHRHTAVITGPRLRLALNYKKPTNKAARRVHVQVVVNTCS